MNRHDIEALEYVLNRSPRELMFTPQFLRLCSFRNQARNAERTSGTMRRAGAALALMVALTACNGGPGATLPPAPIATTRPEVTCTLVIGPQGENRYTCH